MLRCRIFQASNYLEISPVNEFFVNSYWERINGCRDKLLATFSINRYSLNHFPNSICEIQHVLFVINGKTTRLCQVRRDYCLSQSSCHCSPENFSTVSKSSPVSVEEVPFARVNDNSTWSVHVCNVNNLRTIFIHWVDWAVSWISPVNLLVNPIKSNPFRINSYEENNKVIIFSYLLYF